MYQDASILLTKGNKSCSKFVFRSLTDLELRPKKGESRLKVLEVGAINVQLLNCTWMDVTAIDVKSRHPKILEIDFFDIKKAWKTNYDCLVNGMVLNCVETAEKRGQMLVNCHSLLKDGGIFFFTVPKRCFPIVSQLVKILEMIGFELLRKETSPKILYLALKKKNKVKIKQIKKMEYKSTKQGALNVSFTNIILL